ncbi:Uncharacterised protein [uncultured archaeon]|nr:Uncharacterised protein [uncultured archaeon]
MSLDILESVKRVSQSSEFRGKLSESYFCSAITFLSPGKPIDYWDLNYYNPKRCDISHIRVSGDALEMKSVDKPLKKEEPKEIDIKTIQTNVEELMSAAIEIGAAHGTSSAQKVFISLYSESAAIWAINFILAGMRIFQVKIDARDGRIIDSKLHDFLKKEISAQ